METGSGIRGYDLEVSADGGASWTRLLTATQDTSYTFTGELGVAYAFRVRATDRVSNTSTWVQAEAKTVVVKKYYSVAGQRVGMRENGVLYYLHSDHLGSTSLTTNESGDVAAAQKYLPYGEVRWVTGTLPTDLTYTGQRSENGLGLMDYRARFYSGRLGRFISADSIVPGAGSQHLSRYMYVTGNPILYRDPTGHALGGPQFDPGNEFQLVDNKIPWWQQVLEFVAGVVTQYGNDMALGIPQAIHKDLLGGSDPSDYRSDAFQTGRVIGRVASYAHGAASMAGGIIKMVEGAGLTGVTGGGAAVLGMTLVAEGAVEVVYGEMVIVRNLSDPDPLISLAKRSGGSEWRPLKRQDLPSGYEPPSGGARRVTVQHGPNKGRKGWLDKHGDIWVPTRQGEAHGGPHWDVQINGGRSGYRSVWPKD